MEHLGFRRSSSLPRHNSSTINSHKTMKQRLDRMENTVTAIPQTLGEYIDAFNSFCLSGIKFASLLETLFQDTPILIIALRFREACEQLNDKFSKSTLLLKGDVVSSVTKKLAPSLSRLRNRIDSHAKALSKHESHAKQLEGAQNLNKQKLDQVESKFQASAKEYSQEDSLLAEARNEVYKIRVEVMGSCFLGFLEAQSKLLVSASDLMAPLGAYKEMGKGLSDSSSNSAVKEATVGWLAAAQVNQNLRSFGSLSRNDVQCMMYSHTDGLPTTIIEGLNVKVNQLLKKYIAELKLAPNPHHKVTGGFHLNPKGIELALRDCCSELEARGAGAPHAQTKVEKDDQIARDVPRTSYKIMGEEFGCTNGENVERNIRDKLQSIQKLIYTLPFSNQPDIEEEKVHDFALHILNESCTTVTNTAAKTAVQLVFGKANLVLVRPAPSSKDILIEIEPRQVDSSVILTVHSSWWLVEDYVAFAMLSRTIDPSASLGVVDVTYTFEFKFSNFLKEDSPELPSIAVTYQRHLEKPTSDDRTSRSLKDKDSRLHINRTLKMFLSVRRRTHSPGSGTQHKSVPERDPNKEQETGSSSLEKGEFRGYGKMHNGAQREDNTSSGSSPLSDSPGVDRTESPGDRTAGLRGEERTTDITLEYKAEEEEEDADKGEESGRRVIRQIFTGGEDDRVELTSSHSSQRTICESGGSSGSGFNHQNKAYGRNDSFGHGQRPNYYPYQLKRYPSNDSMSSQSTLVAKLAFEPDYSSMGIADIVQSDTGYGLTQSNIEDHMNKLHHGKHYSRTHHHHHHHQDEMFGYDKEREGFRGQEEVRARRRGRLPRRDVEAEGTMDDEEVPISVSPFDMHVSPTDSHQEKVCIASDSEVQSVIEFLSRSKSFESSINYTPEGRDQGNQQVNGEYPYSSRNYNKLPDYLSSEREWGHSGDLEKNKEHAPAQSDSSSGSSGVGMDNVAHDLINSRSASLSPGMEREEGKAEGLDNDKKYYSLKDSFDSGINLRTRSQKKKQVWDHPDRESTRKSKEFSLDFTKGFGPLISSDQVQSSEGNFAMDMLHRSKNYQLSLQLMKGMADDSDSERSGRDSIPLISSSSSETQSPLLFRTKSAENITVTERSASRTSTHSMPFPSHAQSPSSHLDEDLFNHAPGSKISHHNRGHPFSNFEYEERLSQGSYNGGRGSHSQGSNDWDWEVEPRGRPHPHYDYVHPYKYDNAPPRGVGYDSPISHSQERQPRSLQRGMMGHSHEDYSLSPGPPLYDRRHNMMPHGPIRGSSHHSPMPPPPGHGPMPGGPLPPPSQGPMPGGPLPPPPQGPMPGPPPPQGPGPMYPHHGPGGPMGPPHGPGGPLHCPPPVGPPHHVGPGHGPPWYDAPFDSPRMRGPPPQPPGPLHHPVHDNRFRPVPFGGRSNTPSDAPSPASMHSMSPGPSPHPTPPPTPPPNMGVPPHHGPPLPGPPQFGHAGPPGMHHMAIRGPRPPPPWEGPGRRDFGPPHPPHPGGHGPIPPPLNHTPSPNMPGPPVSMHAGGGGIRYMSEWERNSWQHH